MLCIVYVQMLSEERLKLQKLQTFVRDVTAELQDQEAKASRTRSVVEQVHTQVQADKARSEARYRQALEELGGLSELDLAELRSYKDPHVLVRLVVMALCVIFEWPHDWHNALRLLGEQNPKLMDRCV